MSDFYKEYIMKGTELELFCLNPVNGTILIWLMWRQNQDVDQ